MDHVEITKNKIEIENVLSILNNFSSGATAVFLGTTRNHYDGKTVVTLDYEAYESMAIKEITKICTEMKSKWPLNTVAIVHRIGRVDVGEVSVLVAATSVHRKEAQESVMFGIDAVKAIAPIWKKEIYSDDTCNWKANSECAWK